MLEQAGPISGQLEKGNDVVTAMIEEFGQNYALDQQIGYLLRLASQRHANIFLGNAPKGLTPMQFSALIRIAEVGECSQNHLGRMTSMDVATIKGVVDRLKKKGMMVTEPDAHDKRRTIIKLTKSAKALVDELFVVGCRISEETLRPLSKSEQATLLRLLKKIS